MAGQHVDFGYSLALCVEVQGNMMAQQQKTYTYLYIASNAAGLRRAQS